MYLTTFLYFLLLFIIVILLNNNKITTSSLLVFIYLVMSFCSIILQLNIKTKSIYPANSKAFLYFVSILTIIFISFNSIKETRIQYIIIPNSKLFKLIFNIVLVSSYIAMIFFLFFINQILFTGNISNNRYIVSSFSSKMGKFGLLNTYFSLISNLFMVNLLNAVINLNKRNFKKAIMCIIGSLSYVTYILSYAGRDGIVYWLFSIIFFYIFFKKFIPKIYLKKLAAYLLFIFGILFFFFMLITTSRFENSKQGVLGSIISYMGQAIGNFNDFFFIMDLPLSKGTRNFPLLVKLNILQPLNINVNYYFNKIGLVSWLFKTFIGSLIYDFGKFGTYFILLLFALINYLNNSKIKKTIYFHQLMIYILFFQIVYWGVFYFRLYSANLYILAIIFLCIISRIKQLNRTHKYIILTAIYK